MTKIKAIFTMLAVFILANFATAQAEDNANWYDTLTMEGMIDARAVYKAFDVDAEDVDKLNTSDIQVRYAGLGAVIEPSDFVEGYILFLFEEFYGGREDAPFAYFGDGSENFDMDEGWLKLHYQGAYFRMGKGYLPFTHESTFAVKDPMTWYFGDCRHSLLEIGYEHDYGALSFGAFNGDFDNADEDGKPADDAIDDFVLHAHVNPLAGVEGYDLEIGGGYLSDITEAAVGADFIDPNSNYETNVPGYSGYLHFEGEFSDNVGLGVELEYATSGRFDKENYVDASGEETAVSVVNAEVQVPFAHKHWIGAKYESISGLDWLNTAQYDKNFEPTEFSSYSGFAGTAILEPVTLAFQFTSGVDDESNTLTEVTFQTLLEF